MIEAVRIAIAEALYQYDKKDQALEILEQSLDTPETMTKLRALNTIQALNPKNPSSSLIDKISIMKSEHSEQWGTDYYIRRACTTILNSDN